MIKKVLLVLILLVFLGLILSGIIIRKLVKDSGQSFTDSKTGATINLGINKIPDTFPKDFPIYSGATVTSSQTGTEFWLTLSTNDQVNVVTAYYADALKTNGWNPVQASTTSDALTTESVSKNNLTGYITIEKAAGDKTTSIIVVLKEVK